MDETFDSLVLAEDLCEVRHIYERFFAALDVTGWDNPVRAGMLATLATLSKPGKGGKKEWTLHETIAHLCALNGAGLESIKHTLRGEPYNFVGLASSLSESNGSDLDLSLVQWLYDPTLQNGGLCCGTGHQRPPA